MRSTRLGLPLSISLVTLAIAAGGACSSSSSPSAEKGGDTPPGGGAGGSPSTSPTTPAGGGGAGGGGTDAGSPDSGESVTPRIGEAALPCAKDPSASTKYRFAAQASAEKADKYPVPKESNPYTCWVFKSPSTVSNVTDYAPILDNKSVVHHIILYSSKTAPFGGKTGPLDCRRMPTGANFQYGWAPGGTNFAFPPDVDQKIPADSYLILQIHYNNPKGLDGTDASGVAYCAGKPRARHAGIFWLGSIGIDIPAKAKAHEVVGTCPPPFWPVKTIPIDFEVLGAAPHMHTLGNTLCSDIVHADGTTETLVKADPYSFNDQGFYPFSPPKMLRRGDKVVTHCIYDNPGSDRVGFGENTEDEMCFNFLYTIPDANTLAPNASLCVSQ